MWSWVEDIRELSYRNILAERDVKPFIAFGFMLLTFAISRLYILLVGDTFSLLVYKYHIHHFYYGILFLTLAAGLAIMLSEEEIKRISAALLGIGLGLILDEIGILLTCGTKATELCDPLAIYWSRLSYDIIIYSILLFSLALFFIPVWYRNHDKIKGLLSRFF